ncbi:MAG: FAD-dependent oxidoreductase [Burkholderiaceae bacterium]|nr:FAD-dependent oxidoreductase [Burkholderiaceae bacterium]
MKRVAVVGSGIAGLSAAWLLSEPGRRCRVTLFEAGDYAGGHAHTVDVTLPGADGQPVRHGVDTGFLVFNHRTYPQLLGLFEQLGVPTAPSDMSFSVQAEQGRLEWSGSNLSTVFAQRRNLARPRFLRMLADLLRFNRVTTALAREGSEAQLDQSIGEFLDAQGFSEAFRRWYFLPMVACIWSCPTEQMLRFPVATLIRFCHNHGLLQIEDRPQWHTVRGGSREYVQRLLPRVADLRLRCPVEAVRPLTDGVMVHSRHGSEHFDEVVLACHADQSLALLGAQASAVEQELLGAIRFHANRAVLHTDTALLPRRRAAWAAWNYEHGGSESGEARAVCLHYLINRLQPLPFAQEVIVSLNPVREPDPARVLGEFDYAHPVFDRAAIAAQARLGELQGQRRLWFCGAWTGYGFHEDGLKSAQSVVAAMQAGWAAQAPRLAA